MVLVRLRLLPLSEEEGRFQVIVERAGGGEPSCESTLPFGGHWRSTILKALHETDFRPDQFPREEELDWMVAAKLLTSTKDSFHPNMRANIGRMLYDSIFPRASEVREVISNALFEAETKDAQLHIQIVIEADKAESLADYPWEMMHDDQGFLALRHVSFSRYIAFQGAPPNLSRTDKLNVLLVSSSAFDPEIGLVRLNEQEQQTIHEGLEKSQQAGDIYLETLEQATLDALRIQITEHRGSDTFHAIHFDGHGVFGKCCTECHTIHMRSGITRCRRCNAPLPERQGYLVFENEVGGADYVSAEEFSTAIHTASLRDGAENQRGIVLVVLSACQSAMALGGDSVFNGVAQNLIKHRTPAVVAMQFPIRVDAAATFAEHFYRSIGQEDPLSLAVKRGQEAIGILGNQWYRPILYLRWTDNAGGQLFEEERTPEVYSDLPEQFDALVKLIAAALEPDPAARRIVDDAKEDLKDARQQITPVAEYKHTHDLLQDLELFYGVVYQDIYDEHGDLLPPESINWRYLSRNIVRLQTIILTLCNHVNSTSFATDAASWVRDLNQASEHCDVATEQKDIELLGYAADTINRVISMQTYNTNARLIGAVDALELPNLVEQLEHVHNDLISMPAPRDDGSTTNELADYTTVLTRFSHMAEDLTRLRNKHDQYQQLDHELRAEEGQLSRNLGRFKMRWDMDLKAKMYGLLNGSGTNAPRILDAPVLKLETALVNDSLLEASDAFFECRSIVIQRLKGVDQDLKSLCDELIKIGNSLDSLPDALE